MPQFEVIVELKPEVLDAEGRAITSSLANLGWSSLKNVKVAKRFLLDFDGSEADAVEIAKEYLANPVSETFKLKRLE